MRRRIHTPIDQENYTFFPAKEPRDFFGESSRLSVAVYARVSTGNVEQTSSYELQKKYYEDYVRRHPNWNLVRIYADEGISGTSLARREQFHQMITDCKAGKIDLILTKSVSRFARNVVDCISTVRMLGGTTPGTWWYPVPAAWCRGKGWWRGLPRMAAAVP